MIDISRLYLTKTQVEEYNYEGDITDQKVIPKIILSLSTFALATTPIVSQKTVQVESQIISNSGNSGNKFYGHESNSKAAGFNFYRDIDMNDTINMDNQKLEVDDLADKVTKTQLEEVKSHIDTKISYVEKDINEIKTILSRIEDKFENLPDKTFVENEINKTTIKFLLWLGAGLITAAGFLAWYLPLVINVAI